MAPFLDDAFGNPSGLHGVAQRAKNALEAARERAAELIGAERPFEVVFTGGGTEADNLAIAGAALADGQRGAIVTTQIEHEAVLETAAFCERLGCRVRRVGVDHLGRVDVASVAAAVSDDTSVVSVMAANNEVGTIQPIRSIAESVRAVNPSALVHTDAVQAFVSEDITVDALGCDLIALASHKIGGPKGVGLLYVRNGVELEPVIHGGGQEIGRRSGTHNVAGIAGMVAAMEVSVADRSSFRRRVGAARDAFEAGLRSELSDIEVNGDLDARLVQHSHVRFPGVSAETLLVRLDQAGIAAAAGSACQSGAIDVSHVLAAMGFDETRAGESVRFTFGWVDDVDDGVAAAKEVAAVAHEVRR